MANRRMFSIDVINTDLFLDMPVSAQCLYFHLGMRADDDGFIASPKQIVRMATCTQDDMKILVAKGFVIPFESGIVVIRHWKQHNYVPSDRYKKTKYTKEREMLEVKENVYMLYTDCIHDTSKVETQDRLGKDRLGKDNNIYTSDEVDTPTKPSTKRYVFKPPTLEEVQAYCSERNNGIDAERFIDFYESKGWMVGKNKMKDWKASVRSWERNNQDKNELESGNRQKKNTFNCVSGRDYNMDELEKRLLGLC